MMGLDPNRKIVAIVTLFIGILVSLNFNCKFSLYIHLLLGLEIIKRLLVNLPIIKVHK